ncbi:MAG TPA: penicillin-binding protein 2, partial [Coxiellaceae bacterium]|nr:penicillin-binding protein 2 [Coxiellaceae bacterium]
MKQHSDQPDFQRRYRRMIVGVCIVFIILIIRLFYLQIISHTQYTTLSRNNFLNVMAKAPERGLIYDRNGVLLAKNIPSYTLSLIPGKIKNMDATLEDLRTTLDIDNIAIKRFKHRLNQYHAYDLAPLPTKLNEEQIDRFYVNAYRFPGASITASLQREYPLKAVGSSVVGYVGKINDQDLNQLNKNNYLASTYIGKTGIEKGLETTLHGSTGLQQVEINARGQIVHTLSQQPAHAGPTLHLTIDSQLQQFIIKTLGDLSAAVVA